MGVPLQGLPTVPTLNKTPTEPHTACSGLHHGGPPPSSTLPSFPTPTLSTTPLLETGPRISVPNHTGLRSISNRSPCNENGITPNNTAYYGLKPKLDICGYFHTAALDCWDVLFEEYVKELDSKGIQCVFVYVVDASNLWEILHSMLVRQIEATTDAVGGVVCNITRVEGRRWDNHDSEDIPIQVLGDHGYKPHAPIHHQQPPPPLLPPPPNIASNPHPFSGPPPPHFFHRPPLPPHQITPSLQPPALLPPPLVPPPSLHIPPMNGPHISYNSRPPQQRHNYNSIDSRLINYQPPVSTAHSPWVTNINKGTGSFVGNDWASRRQRERDSDRPRNLATNNYRTCVNSLKTLQPLVLL
ncbi:Hypothetical predicted protein [Pelobates cultripes]|nr:Hypothetical predicted protein [Pelobates cultripes]